jgi:hypothetical protein
MSERCQGTTKKGAPCPNPAAEGRPYCLSHDPERGEERRARMATLGKSGARKKKQRKVEAAGEAVPLETAADIRAALSRSLAKVEASGADPIAQANATARLCSAALALLRTAELEAQVAELRALVMERFPDARKRLERVK